MAVAVREQEQLLEEPEAVEQAELLEHSEVIVPKQIPALEVGPRALMEPQQETAVPAALAL